MAFEAELRNTQTGRTIKIDPVRARLSRMRKRVWSWSEAVKELETGRLLRKVLITLTYRDEVAWEANQIKKYIKALKRELGDDCLALAWVAEMTKRGRMHYHVYMIVNKGTRIPKPDESGMWPHGLTRIETGKTPYYLLAYLKKAGKEKEYQKIGFPKGARIFSIWIKKLELRVWTWTKYRWSALPSWLQLELQTFGFLLVGLFPKRKAGGGWILDLPEDRRVFINWKAPAIEFYSPWVIA
jgi:hypothetical protein